MKSHSAIKSWMTIAAVCVLALGASTIAFRAQADPWDKKTILTVDQPIQVTDTYLEPGTYVFKLADSSADRHIVQIFNANQTRVIDTILAIPNYRLQPTDKSRFAFWETPPGTARAMRAWFYPGDNFGQEFRYPKHLTQLAVVTPAPVLAPVPPAAPPAPEPPVLPPPPPPQAVNTPPEEPSVIAQNTAPAPPPEAAPAPAPAPAPELPKTGTPYPMIGLSGLFSFGLYGLARLKRSA
jgi:hypothetical protein